MFNIVKLPEGDWCFQRYLCDNDLDQDKISQEKIVNTLIFDTKASVNQTDRTLSETSWLLLEGYSEVKTSSKMMLRLIIVSQENSQPKKAI